MKIHKMIIYSTIYSFLVYLILAMVWSLGIRVFDIEILHPSSYFIIWLVVFFYIFMITEEDAMNLEKEIVNKAQS